MSEVSIIGLDIAKSVFQVHGADASGRALLRKKVSRAKLLRFFAAQPHCQVVLEAYSGAHHWARELVKLGHDVRLIAPAYVKPFVKRQKNDAADAEAICEAAQRPSMRFVPVKSEAQQTAALVFRARDLLGPVEIHRVRIIVAPMWIMASKLVSVLQARIAIRLNSLSF